MNLLRHAPHRSSRILLWGFCAIALGAELAVANASAANSSSGIHSPSAPSIAVSGEGEIQIEPDIAHVPITVENDATNGATAGADNARDTQAVVSALRAAGAKPADIVTQLYTVQPQWTYPPSKPPYRSGYRASTQLQLTVSDLKQLGVLVDTALSSGASGIGDISYDSSRMQSARQTALAQAVQHAQTDAGTLAQSAGGKLGALLELSSQQPGLQPGVLREAVVVTAARRDAPATSFQTPHLQIHAVVFARWAFLSGTE